jgi:hypothetical protein
LPVLADPHRAPADYRTIPAQDDGRRPQENAPAVGQPRDAQAITESVAGHILKCYMEYYNAVRTHLSLGKDAPIGRAIQRHGRIEVRPVLGGLHHQYVRI